jgi:hypothetical protein
MDGREKLVLAVLVSLLLLVVQSARAEEQGWQPEKTWVFVVGVLEWKHSDKYCSYPQKDRRDAQLVEFFKQRGVPAEQIVYLQDKQATLRGIQAALAAHLGKAKEGDWLFLYYCGHGAKPDAQTTCFVSYDTGDESIQGWSVVTILNDIEKHFNGSRAILTADCCYSGALAQEAEKSKRRVSYACLSSSSASQSSTGNWTFTEGLLAGFRGKACVDIDGDGQITLQEMAKEIEEDMAFADEQRASFATTEGFSPGTVIAKAEKKSGSEVGRRVEVLWKGTWYKAQIIEAAEGKSKVQIGRAHV